MVGRFSWPPLEHPGTCENVRNGEEAGMDEESAGQLTAVYEHTDDGWWVVSVPEIPGANSQGETFEEAQENIRDAVALLLEVRREDSQRDTEGRDVREVRREPLTF